jgi:hypothetical protein
VGLIDLHLEHLHLFVQKLFLVSELLGQTLIFTELFLQLKTVLLCLLA